MFGADTYKATRDASMAFTVKAIPSMQEAIILSSVITCPVCGYSRTETMPTDACIYFYECTSCKGLLRPLPGDCCVFCSYGSVKCPPVQTPGSAMGAAADSWLKRTHAPHLIGHQSAA